MTTHRQKTLGRLSQTVKQHYPEQRFCYAVSQELGRETIHRFTHSPDRDAWIASLPKRRAKITAACIQSQVRSVEMTARKTYAAVWVEHENHQRLNS